MANQTVTPQLITVHGRGSLTLYWRPRNEAGERIDVSDWTVSLEVDGASVKQPFVKDPNDPLGLMTRITRSKVETLSTTPTKMTFIDERQLDDGLPYVVFECKIARYGYKGMPDQVDDQ